jgi:hypothetical protein
VGPSDRHPLLVEAGRQAVIIIGADDVVPDVLFVGPDDFDWCADLFDDVCGLGDVIDLQPPAKAAIQKMAVNPDLVPRQPGRFADRRLGPGDDLVPNPDIAAVRAHLDGAIQRLHRRVRQIGNLIDRLDLGRLARRAWAAAPFLRGTTPGCCEAASIRRTISALESVAFVPSSYSMSSAANPCLAAHMLSATTATASSSRTIWCTR